MLCYAGNISWNKISNHRHIWTGQQSDKIMVYFSEITESDLHHEP